MQQELDKVFDKERFPPLNPAVPSRSSRIVGCRRARCWRSGGSSRSCACGGWRGEEAAAGFVFIAPWLFGFLALTAGPILASIFLSFCDYDVLHPARWVGLNNYTELLGRDSYYLQDVALSTSRTPPHSAFRSAWRPASPSRCC